MLTGLACWWLAFRVGHVVTYIAGFARVRTLLMAWLNCLLSDDGTGINLEQFQFQKKGG